MRERGKTLAFDCFLSYSKIISEYLIVSFVRPFLTHKLFMVHKKTLDIKKSVAVYIYVIFEI
jgi:hypothetical protein